VCIYIYIFIISNSLTLSSKISRSPRPRAPHHAAGRSAPTPAGDHHRRRHPWPPRGAPVPPRGRCCVPRSASFSPRDFAPPAKLSPTTAAAVTAELSAALGLLRCTCAAAALPLPRVQLTSCFRPSPEIAAPPLSTRPAPPLTLVAVSCCSSSSRGFFSPAKFGRAQSRRPPPASCSDHRPDTAVRFLGSRRCRFCS
jgi:hypothetical protein